MWLSGSGSNQKRPSAAPVQVLNLWQAGRQSHLAYVGFDFGPDVLDLVLQQGVIHHLLQLIPDGVTQVARRPSICQVVVPAGKDHCGEGEQLVAVHKPTVSLTLHLQTGCVRSLQGGNGVQINDVWQ